MAVSWIVGLKGKKGDCSVELIMRVFITFVIEHKKALFSILVSCINLYVVFLSKDQDA